MNHREKAKKLLAALKAENHRLAEHLNAIIDQMNETDVNEAIRTISKLIPSIAKALAEQGIDANEGAGVQVSVALRVDKFDGEYSPDKKPVETITASDYFTL